MCYTGSLFEEEILAECIFEWNTYVDYAKCIELVKANQPKFWNPCDPPTAAANDLHALIVEALNEQYDNVRLFTALRTPLDRYHGVDCFVEYGKKIVTIDVTINSHKQDYKADFILSENDIYNDEGKVNQTGLRLKAQIMAKALAA